MNDPLRTTLERLEGPVSPDPRFAEDLFARLLDERDARRRPFGRASRGLRPTNEGLRRTLIAAAALLLAGVVFVLMLPILRPSQQPAPGGSGEMPPFHAVVEFTVPPGQIAGEHNPQLTSGKHRIDVVYAGSDAWRFEVLDDGFGSILPAVAGSFGAWDGERFRIYDAGQNAFGQQEIGPKDFTILNPLAWSAPGGGWEESCPDAEVTGTDVVLGREATTVACGGTRLWVDEQTGLVLRADAAEDAGSLSFEGPLGLGPGGEMRVVELEVGTATEADAAFNPPADAVPFQDVVTPPTTLTVGEPVPALPNLEAQGLQIPSANGRPVAVYAWATWCPPCVGGPLAAFEDEAVAHVSDLNAYAVAVQDTAKAATGLFESEGYGGTLLNDVDGELDAWGIQGVPTLVLLDADGRMVGAYVGDLDGSDVRAILQAFLAGDPLPDVGGKTVAQTG